MPDAYYHRHSRIPLWNVVERSIWERTTTATGKLLHAAHDHPAVTGVAYDVVISAVSLVLWAALRPLKAADLLGVSNHAAEGEQDDESSPALRGGAHKRKYNPKSKGDKKTIVPETSPESPEPRRRGRPRKARWDPVEEPGDDTYEPTTGEAANAPVGDPPAQGVDLETAAVAWGLIAIGGLALGSASVLGGELLA